jgi:Na+/H+ antiporter NhaA
VTTQAATEQHAGETRPRHRQLVAQLARQRRQFMRTEAGSAGLLLAAALAGLVWANSPWSEGYVSLWSTELAITLGSGSLALDLRHWVNDGLMAIFFFVIGLEVRRELQTGELTDRRRVVVPAVAALGGMLVPVAIYLLVAPAGEAARGWGIVIGTDTAFLLGALAIVGPACPTQLRVFLLTLTVFDDAAAVTIIGLAYSDALDPVALFVAAACLVALWTLGRIGEWRSGFHVAIAAVLWVATLESGLHPTIAGMAAGLLIPARPPSRRDVDRAAKLFRAFGQSPGPDVGRSAARGLLRVVSVNERLQTVMHPWTSFVIVPVFALANAGVDLRGGVLGDALGSPVTWGVVAGLVAGKLAGIGAGALGAVRAGAGELPRGVGEGQVLGGAALSGIGFTVSLLIANLAFDTPALVTEATVGVLLSAVFATALAWVVFRLAAVLRGERTATLPYLLAMPVDPARDHIRGPAGAPLTLVEYADFECPFCLRSTGAIRDLRERFGDDLRYVFRHLPLTDVHGHAEAAAVAAEAAGAQGRFWEMHDLLFDHQGALEDEDLVRYAEQLGLDVDRFLAEIDEGVHEPRVREDVESAEASGATGTPTFFVGDRRHTGPHDAATLARALEATRAGGAA